MTDDNVKINHLLERLETLLKRQDSFAREINELRDEILKLKTPQTNDPIENKPIESIDTEEKVIQFSDIAPQPQQEVKVKIETVYSDVKSDTSPKEMSNIEKFIGENLINKIGIAITVIGVAIGAKYSIEHQLISPLTRIILGYLAGLGLLGFAIKLKKNYENYSAVLISGAIAIMYFITYSAYSFYDLIPQAFAFLLMVIFTVFTVVAAISYNKQVIAHIGLVGAYAVPFLLSEGSSKVAILFSYITIINIGILIIAFKKYWKPLYYSSFVITWLIFFGWYASRYQTSEHFGLALTFMSIFFSTFYSIFLAYKLIQKEEFDAGDIILLLANSFIFFGLGYSILNAHATGKELLGLFTLCNAIIHFGVGVVIYQQKLADRNLFYLVTGLVLVFITIAVPVQLNGNWVTLFWAGEAALLFCIGTSKDVSYYERLSYILMFLAFFSIVHDWINVYSDYLPSNAATKFSPIFNIHFLSSLLFIASFVFINYLNSNRKNTSAPQNAINSFMNFSIPAILIIVLYFSFRLEISTYWNQLYANSALEIKPDGQDYPNNYWDYDLKSFKAIWLINYSLLFFSLLSLVNVLKIKNKGLGIINLAFSTLFIIVFLTLGLYLLSDLRDSYTTQSLSEYYHRGVFNILIRYISFAFVGLMFITSYKIINQKFIKPTSLNLRVAFDILLFVSIIWISSSELITWMDIMKSTQTYRLGLSILWGLSALTLIVLGIWKNKKHLRVGAIILFAITLLKLIFYDVSHLETIQKTILFVSLGVLLLIISFLYNKYKHLI